MQEETFPFRLDTRTRQAISDLAAAMMRHKFSFQGTVGRTQMLFFDKDEGIPIDVPINFSTKGVTLDYPMNAVAKYNPESRQWLQKYHQFLVAARGNLDPVPQRCHVTIEADQSGQLRYYLTYMTTHPDGSLAQDMPQGKLYASEPLFLPASHAEPASMPKPKEPAEPAGWLEQE